MSQNGIGSTTPMLTWNPQLAADSYILQVAKDSGFSTIVVNESGIINTSYVVSVPFDKYTLYYWRVAGVNTEGVGSWSPAWRFTSIYDAKDFPTDMIDPTVWTDLEFVRRINNGVLESELRRYGANGSNYLHFYNPSIVNSFRADVTVKAFENNGSYPHASLLGYVYKGEYERAPGDIVTGDVLGVVGIGHNGTQRQGFYSISICTTANCNLPNEYYQICTGSFDTDLGVPSLNTTYPLSFSWDQPNIKFTFGIGTYTKDVDSSNCSVLGLPTYVGPPDVDTKGIGTRVTNITTASGEGGFIVATFDSVYADRLRVTPTMISIVLISSPRKVENMSLSDWLTPTTCVNIGLTRS
jgi:hypothetical protein